MMATTSQHPTTPIPGQRQIAELSQRISSAVWGPNANSSFDHSLQHYFDYCARELRQAENRSLAPSGLEEAVIQSISTIKAHLNVPRQNLEPSYQSPEVLDVAVRLMLMTSCRVPDTVSSDIVSSRWKSQDTLSQYLDKLFTPSKSGLPDESKGDAVTLEKLAVGYLGRYADIKIQWTDRLTDHLCYQKDPDWKYVYIFKHPSFLLRSLDALATNNQEDKADSTATSSLSVGCLPRSLLRETLLTYDILFPPVRDARSRRILDEQIVAENLDPALRGPFQFVGGAFDQENDEAARPPQDIRELYQRYPVWASKLHKLWTEANDPSPTTYIGKLSERKKSPRFTYWCTVVGISIAIMFGVFSTVLGAAQVWISYCSWVDDPTVRGCGAGKVKSGT